MHGEVIKKNSESQEKQSSVSKRWKVVLKVFLLHLNSPKDEQ